MNTLLILSAVVVIMASLALFLWAVIMRKSRKKQANGDSVSLSGDKSDKGRSMKYWWFIPFVLVVGAVVWGSSGTLGTLSQSLQAPEPKEVWVFFKNYWLWIVLVLAIPFSVLFSVEETWAKAVKCVIGVAAVILTGAMIVHGIWGESSSSQQTQQQFAKPMLKMPPNGNSARISPGAGEIVIFTGDGFEHHVVYADGKDCVVGNTADPCKDGPILHQYVRDTTGKSNSVTYRFVR